MNYGEILKQRLRSIGMNQSRLAEKLGISRQAVSLWIKGKSVPHRNTRTRIDEILSFEGEDIERFIEMKPIIKGCPLCGNKLSSQSRMITNEVCESFEGFCDECNASFFITRTDDREPLDIWNRRAIEHGEIHKC